MASRIPRMHLPQVTPSIYPGRLSQRARDVVSWRPPRGESLRLALYRTAWAPFWIWSDVPAPRFRVREGPLPPGGPAGDHFAGVLNALTRRIWMQRALTIVARAAWLPLLIGCIWLAFELGGGAELNVRVLIALGFVLLLPAAVFAWLVKPSRRQVARMLDRSFVLQERMLTAHENVGKDVVQEGVAPPVTYLQIADAANVITEIRNHPAFRVRPPVREIVLAVVCGLVLAALFFMRGVGGGIPTLASDVVPPFMPAAERLALEPEPVAPAEAAVTDAPTVAEVQAKAERSNQAQQDLRRLGDALSDQAVTRAASEAIQRGDYDEAADLIRQVGDDADQLTQSARDGLADDLDQAANEMSDDSGDLKEATSGAADGLREGGEAANEGLQELGDAVDETASDVVSQEQLTDEMSRATAAEASQSQGEPGEQSDSTSGQPQDGSGQEQSGSEPGETGEGGPQSEQGQPGEQTGEGEPGSGQQEGSASSPMDEDNAGPSGSESQGEPQEGAQPGDGTQPGEASDAQNGESSAEQEGDGGDPGAGAGGGDTQTQTGNETSGGDSGQNPEGEPGDPNVTDAQSGTGDGEEVDPRDALTLPRSPDSEGYQTSSTGGAGSIGSGGPGAASGGGGTNQGDVGAAGPDSNHVPAEYRGIVEAYFSDSEGS